MSKKCIQCGTELEDGALFCDECGAKQEAQQSSKAPVQGQAVPGQKQVQPGIGDRMPDNSTAPVQASGNVPSYASNAQSANQSAGELKNSALGIASFVLGILSVCTLGTSIILDILGVIFGIIALKDPNAKHKLPKAGLIMSVIAVVLFIIIMFFTLAYS